MNLRNRNRLTDIENTCSCQGGGGWGRDGVGGGVSRCKLLHIEWINNEIGSFVETWMDLETVIQNDVSQKNKYRVLTLIHVLTHICGI